ncbi:MAG: regulatory protein RecX [Alphaproteobacteria bacterium]|nr:regulatory protein RecX [Alphaproteobacteria bacterium]
MRRPFGKTAKPPTPQSLANAALQYLGRFAASEASLRRVLENRLRRAALRNPAFAADAAAQKALREAIEHIVEAHKRNGVIDDAAFAETKINSLRRQGRSRRAIEQKLAAKGLVKGIVATALDRHADGATAEEVEFKAALALARRRRLGPFGKTTPDETRRRKEFATLARAGFSSTIARRVLQADAPAEWE